MTTKLAHTSVPIHDLLARRWSGRAYDRDKPVTRAQLTALLEAAQAAGFDKAALQETLPRLAEIPFDAERARMSTLHREGDAVLVLVKGAPEGVLSLCVDQLAEGGVVAIDQPALQDEAEQLALQGLRVLAFALKRLPHLPDTLDPAALETGLTFIGLAGLIDPPRPEAAESVAACKAAGIIPVMITGDHPATARAIAGRQADVGIGIRSVAQLFELDFVPLQAARYDLVVPKAYLKSHPTLAHLFETLVSRPFRNEIEALGGYDTSETGKLHALRVG
jgi:Ca2+-transporting ATPase